ncbi:MAG: ROK family transcriptional regulator [Oscillospiraceae bacterium]|nr:ROK family transcriptional regulator [Oscillospiraceae bacterium]
MPFEGDNMMGVKRNNRSATLRILHEKGDMSRKRLAEYMKLTPPAITKIVAEMLQEGLLREGSAVSSGAVGRREILVELNTHAACGLGVLINLRQAILSATWLDGSVIFSEEIVLPPRVPARETVERLARRLMELAEENRLAREKIVGLGIAVRGITVSNRRGVSDSFGALAEEDVPLCDWFEELTGLRCVLANNVRALLAAQMFLSRDEAGGSQFFLRCVDGIGAALSIDGKIWHGVTLQCSEIGHIPVVRRGGKPCSCGKSGCLETIASPSAILEEANTVLSPEKTPVLWKIVQGKGERKVALDDVFSAASSGDDGAATIVDTAVHALGNAVKSVIYLIDPGKIVLYGRMFDNDYFLAHFFSEMREGMDTRHAVTIEKSRFNHQLEDKAACLLAVQDYFDNGGIL